MKVIIASINGRPALTDIIAENLAGECTKMGIQPPLYLQTLENISNTLTENKNKEFLMFTNFPPDSSYEGSGKTITRKEEGDLIYESWEADSYKKSKEFFSSICIEHSFKAIHFITGAPEEIASDGIIRNCACGNLVSIKRKSGWLKSEIPYSSLLKRYILEKIREQLKKNVD